MKSNSVKLMIFVIGVFVLAGCHKLDVTTKIEPNGSGELRMGVGFSAEERANMEKQNSNPQDFCSTSQTPPDTTITEEQRGDETWCVTTTRFNDLQQLRRLYEQRKGIKINQLEISDKKFYYDVDIDTLSEDSSFSALTDITWSIVLPGAPIQHNADQANKSTLTWAPNPKSGIIHMRAESEVPRSGFNFGPCSATFVGLGLSLIYLRRQRRNMSLQSRERALRNIKMRFPMVLTFLCLLLVESCTPKIATPVMEASATPSNESSQLLFDDFSYFTREQMAANGWIIRSGSGWPSVIGAAFRSENVSFIDYPDETGNRLLRMTSSTDGTSENTHQTQICHQRKYHEGTYAARLRFSDEPVSGIDGDQIVETFYTITPYDRPLNPAYREMDYEYLPNGGWGGADLTFYVTTWETVQIEPWNAKNTRNLVQGSLAGWHTLVTQVVGGTARYFVDGKLMAQHGGE